MSPSLPCPCVRGKRQTQMTVWVAVSRYVGAPDRNPRDAPREARGRQVPDQVPDKVGASGAGRRDRRRSDPQKKSTRQKARWRHEVAATGTRRQDGDVKSPLQERRGRRLKAGLVRRVKTGRRNPADLAGACSGGKFVVSRAGEAYDAQARGPNRKFRLRTPAKQLGSQRLHSQETQT